MSDQYLFEKQGSDAEIERLESLLAAYRIEPIAPQLNEPERSVSKPGIFAWFRMGYAVAFAAVVVVLGTAVVTVRYFDRAEREVVAISPAEPPEADRSFVAPSVIDRAAVDDKIPNNERPTTVKKAKQILPAAARRERGVIGSNTVARETPRLTKEEKYAYDQLMVALWITGSKLKVVQDTINRVDDTKAEPANDKR